MEDRILESEQSSATVALAAQAFGTEERRIAKSLSFLLGEKAILVVAARGCRCPSCGKRIISGVLVLDTCPRCKRNLYTGDKPKKAKKR